MKYHISVLLRFSNWDGTHKVSIISSIFLNDSLAAFISIIINLLQVLGLIPFDKYYVYLSKMMKGKMREYNIRAVI